MSVKSIALNHLESRDRVADKAGRRAALMWQRDMSVTALDQGWDLIARPLVDAVTLGQLTAARQATPYVNRAMAEQNLPHVGDPIEPVAFAGVTREGREIAPELYASVTQTKTLIGRGMGVGAAFASGMSMLQVMAATIVRDAGRAADDVASVARGGVMMARVVQPGACSRCAILAGVGHFTRHFERHPGCRCQTIPVSTTRDVLDFPEGLYSSPEEYFKDLSAAEQDRVFTRAGAEAIRNGADPIQVVNARRGSIKRPSGRLRAVQIGARPDGTPIMGYATVEGTSSRGMFGGLELSRTGQYTRRSSDRYRRTRTQRLMPESIFKIAGDDHNRAVQLLKRYGYIR